MSPKASQYPSPLLGYENAPPLPTGFNADGKSLINIKPGEDLPPLSKAYDEFVDPLDKKNNGFDFHVYFSQTHEEELQYARELHERIRREFPELRIYRLWDKPVGPHPVGMFERTLFGFGPSEHWESPQRPHRTHVMDWETLATTYG